MRRRYNNLMQSDLEQLAQKRVRKIRRFFIHLLIYSIGVVLFIMKKCFNTSFNFPLLHYINWFFMACWTLFIAVKGLKLFIIEVVLGKSWESKKMEEILASESNNQKK
ncbi:2TM domain-containing protein [Flavobacterium sp.]|uniref:2TM domain-containing protein n=1 Tax=Flavobacterium sp. TaxID=239 RepID=UPI0026132B37|nr:2TM domain-containing protein [Flavobacterium sp.]